MADHHVSSQRYTALISPILAGPIAAILVIGIAFLLWITLKLDYAPHLATDFVIEHTPPDNAIWLQNTLGALSMPFALLGGVMYIGGLGFVPGLLYAIFVGKSRWLAILLASLALPAAVWFCFPNQTIAALASLVLAGPVLDFLIQRRRVMKSALQSALPTASDNRFSRRQALTRLGAFILGGITLSAIDGVPVFLSALGSLRVGRKLFDFTVPAPRLPGFDGPDFTPEVTAVEDFYTMRKSPTPIPVVPPDWHLTVDGLVEQRLSFTLDDLVALPRQDLFITRQCISNPVGGNLISTAQMSGVPLHAILDRARVKAGAVDVVLYGRDGYSESIPLDYATEHGLLTYAMNGVFLTSAHGAPLRLEVPGWYGFKNLKWLDRIEVVDKHYVAIWEQEGWTANPTYKTMSRIDFGKASGDRILIGGIAFGGLRGIKAVEVQINGGDWQPATLHTPPITGQTWVQWRAETPARGKLVIAARATDGTGAVQTDVVQKQFPDGASGYHTLTVTG